MDARIPAVVLLCVGILSSDNGISHAAGLAGQRGNRGYRTENFVVSAATPELAQAVGREAERLRKELALLWLGEEIPSWYQPCPIRVNVGQMGAGGETSFYFERGEVFGWKMHIFGSRERVFDSVLPHEITHTIFATHFRQPLPRWADEGACTTVEHASEKKRHQQMLVRFLQTRRGIPFRHMFAMTEYPNDILPLYAQGFSLARYLIEAKGHRTFVDFVDQGLETKNWEAAVAQHYGTDSLGDLQLAWNDWVRQGSPRRTPQVQAPVELASAELEIPQRRRPEPNLIYRGQNDASDIIEGRLVPIDTRRSRVNQQREASPSGRQQSIAQQSQARQPGAQRPKVLPGPERMRAGTDFPRFLNPDRGLATAAQNPSRRMVEEVAQVPESGSQAKWSEKRRTPPKAMYPMFDTPARGGTIRR